MANRKNMNRHLSTNQITPGTQMNGATGNGGSQPPRNMIVPIAHMVAMAVYSPSISIMYGVEPYSTMNPATSSDSASTRSNGGRLVSASAETKKITNSGKSGSQNQLNMPSRSSNRRMPSICASTMSDRFSEPTHNSTAMMTKPMETS